MHEIEEMRLFGKYKVSRMIRVKFQSDSIVKKVLDASRRLSKEPDITKYT